MDNGRLEAVPNGTVHLDTVRALHQTVVSLRTALEVSKDSLRQLKEKYEKHSQCLEYADVIEKLTIENHILRRRVIDLGLEERDPVAQNIKLEVTYSPQTSHPASEVVIETATEAHSAHSEPLGSAKELSATPTFDNPFSEENSNFCSMENLNKISEGEEIISESAESNATADTGEFGTEDTHTESDEISQLISHSEKKQQSYKTKLELLSKFDVRIKVRNLKEGTVLSSSNSDSDSTFGEKARKDSNSSFQHFQFEQKSKQFDTKEDSQGNQINLKTVATENVKMALPSEADAKSKTDKFNVQVRITSEENLVVKENLEKSRRKDTLNLDVDDLSLRSLSEGDNSVFSEGAATPVEQAVEEKQDGSGNESEVDDIELIFTTHESKDMSMNLQEDLVSIRETDTDTWAPNSTHSTPVLIKFHTLDPEYQPPEPDTQTDSLRKRVSLPNDKEIRHVALNKDKVSLDLPGRGILKTCENKSDNMLYRKGVNRLNSVDSLSGDYNRQSFDNTKSCSFEMGSSMDILTDHHLGHRFSVFAERDISKCGTSEDDLALSLNMRRNTCPNPFQYRPPPYRGVSRPPGPLKAPLGAGAGAGAGAAAAAGAGRRAVLREAGLPRRENAAQTDLSALPDRWSSDSYLAHQQVSAASSAAPPTLPLRAGAAGGTGVAVGAGEGRRAPRAPRVPPPLHRTDETRRVLLSDIGFTSMVPELSRSADPIWELAKKQMSEGTITNSASKFLSRGSSYRWPCPIPDPYSDWFPYKVCVQSLKECRSWRNSLPDVRRDDTDELLKEADMFIHRSIHNLYMADTEVCTSHAHTGRPYIPAGPKNLRLGHTVKIIAPNSLIAVGRVRYVGLAGDTAASSSILIGVEICLHQHPRLSENDGMHRGTRYFATPPHCTALFVPFSKVVMAWGN